jgi:hypothetical protein
MKYVLVAAAAFALAGCVSTTPTYTGDTGSSVVIGAGYQKTIVGYSKLTGQPVYSTPPRTVVGRNKATGAPVYSSPSKGPPGSPGNSQPK